MKVFSMGVSPATGLSATAQMSYGVNSTAPSPRCEHRSQPATVTPRGEYRTVRALLAAS
jgi:hypothetical protein